MIGKKRGKTVPGEDAGLDFLMRNMAPTVSAAAAAPTAANMAIILSAFRGPRQTAAMQRRANVTTCHYEVLGVARDAAIDVIKKVGNTCSKHWKYLNLFTKLRLTEFVLVEIESFLFLYIWR